MHIRRCLKNKRRLKVIAFPSLVCILSSPLKSQLRPGIQAQSLISTRWYSKSAMDIDGSEYDSEPSETARPQSEVDIPPKAANEVIEDLTGEADDLLNDAASLSSLSLVDGPPVIKPRAYQTEMVRESLRRNVIVAVSLAYHV